MDRAIFQAMSFSKTLSILVCKRKTSPTLPQALLYQAPECENAIQAGKDARHIWLPLRKWRGGDLDGYFNDLGAWAEKRMNELSGTN